MNLKPRILFQFLFLVVTTILAVYFLPSVFNTVWILILLILYWFSKDEPFWLAFFLILTDGFMGFFGFYEVSLSILPGLPAIEISQFYIILTILKARTQKPTYPLFFRDILNIMGLYVLLLIIIGIVIGIENSFREYFKIVKLTLPFLLFYSIPRLIKNKEDFLNFFGLIFPITILALIAQLFEIVNLQSIPSFIGARVKIENTYDEGDMIRSFYNMGVLLLSMFGSLYYFTKKQTPFKTVYLNIITVVSILIAFLSGTRGWIIGFGIILMLFLVINLKFNLKRLIRIMSLVVLVYFSLMSFPATRNQFDSAINRFMSVEQIAEGDAAADNTQIRTTERSPRVMKKWRDSPILGYGFSEEYNRSYDGHVGNQNILLHSGIIGFALMLIFFLIFIGKIIQTTINTSNNALMVFIVFLIGWLIIHSTSGQHFSYTQIPAYVMPQAIFFCFAAFSVAEAENQLNLQK